MSDSISAVKLTLKDWLLSAEFTAMCAAVSAEYTAELGVPFVVPPPAVGFTHELVAPPPQFPAFELLGLRTQPELDSTAQMYVHDIDVLWSHASDTEETLVRIIEGLVLATRRLTYAKQLSIPGGFDCTMRPGPEDYGPLIRRGRMAQPLVKGATIRLRVPTIA